MVAKADNTRAEATNRRRTNPLLAYARHNGLQIGIVAVALVVWLVFLIAAPRTFTAYEIYNSFMAATPYFALMAIPLTLVVITGEIDLSFGSIMAWGMVVYALVYSATGSVAVAFIGLLAAGLVAGWLNGILITKVGIPSLVATIGTQFLWRGVVLIIRSGKGESLVPSKGTILDQLLVGRLFDRIPAQFIWTIIIAICVWIFLNRHRFGAHVYLTGDNIDSARLLGVNVHRIKTACFAIVGVFAAFAGLVQSLDVSYFWPTVGEGQLMNTLSSVFLGGTSVFGGTGTIFGTFVASYIIGAINAGIVAAGLTGFWTQFIYGLIIVLSVGLQTVVGRRLH